MKQTKTAVITGASRRLGLFLCQQLMKRGWRVYAISRGASAELNQLVEQGLTVLDVSCYDAASGRNVAECLIEQLGQLDLLVNNASLFDKDQNFDESDKSFQLLFDVHMAFPATLVEGLSPLLLASQQGADIINITDIYVANPNPLFSLYCATKAGLDNLNKSWAKQLAPKVKVNSIRPGPIKFLPSHQAAEKQQVMRETLLDFEGGFEPIWQAVEYLMINPFVTGTDTFVDGGRALGR